MADGAFSFVSWVRRGLATGISVTEGATNVGANVPVVVSVTFNGDLVTNPGVNLRLVGPGDIVGLDSGVICRTWPHADDFDAEYIPYALIEFDQADLPWRYTPAQAKTDAADPAVDQLRPWFGLIVLEASDCSLTPSSPTQKLAVLNVKDVAKLPPRSELWAWAHTQFEGSSLDATQALGKLTGAPGLFTARVMSPRLLQPSREYLACLVPTFERGRKIGLGEDPGNIDALDGWAAPTSGAFSLPVYYSWRFRTGTVGNFEQVARLIRPFKLPANLGFRDMDVRDPGFGLNAATSNFASLPVQSALMSIPASRVVDTWPDSAGSQFIADLTQFINDSVSAVDPKLAPPMYAQWYAAQQRLDTSTAPGTNPPWFRQLNVDPRYRVAAALGTKVIQREQQALLASGWDQVEEIPVINDQLRVLQLARGLLIQLYLRHFKTATMQRFYQWTKTLHAEVTCNGNTICYNWQSSPIVPGFSALQWLRWTRPYGPIGRVQGRPGNAFVQDLITQLNDCRKPAPDPEPPGGLSTPPGPGGGLSCEYVSQLVALGSEVLTRWGLLILWVTRNLLVQRNGECWWVGLKALRYAISLIEIAISGTMVVRRCHLVAGTTTKQDVLDVPPQPANFPLPGGSTPLPTLPGGSGTVDSQDAVDIRAALSALFDSLVAPAELTCPPSMDLPQCHTTLTAALEPEITVVETVKDWLWIDPSLLWNNQTDPLQPVFAQPNFEQPMYLPLKEISSDWILAGLNDIPRDSVGLAVLNQRFIEAYMAGLNHEMTRELLWNEFPTDQRGTYFRRFWDVAGCNLDFGGSPLPPEQMNDINPLRLWPSNSALGTNNPRPMVVDDPTGTQPFIVLVVRAQLIEKYPNVIVYAQTVSDGKLTGAQEHPMFYALLKPDTAFYGFKLTEAMLRSNSNWYFVLQEQPGDPKFADPSDDQHDTPRYTSASLGASAGAIAEKTFLQPFRLGIQASTMLPEQP